MTITLASVATEIPRAYSVETFCLEFDVGRTSVFAEIKHGRLRARKVGRRTIILAADAEAWAASLPERSVEEDASKTAHAGGADAAAA